MNRTTSRSTVGFIAALLLAGVLTSSTAPRTTGAQTDPSPVLVELFTSEGCSSCPPADEFLTKLQADQPIPGVQIIGLEEHVDYWNHDGWMDPYSGAEWTTRQQDYTTRLKGGSPYTPQMIVDGQKEFVGNNAKAAVDLIRDLRAARLSLSLEITPDWRVLSFAIAVSAATVLLFGLVPALTAARQDLHPLLKEARAGGGWRGRQALVAMQVALCTMLLVGAGLTILTLRRLQGINAGFESSHIVTFSVDPDMAKYRPEQAAELQRRLIEGARELPDVESAAISSRGLMRGNVVSH